MRKKTRELLASRQAELASRPRVAPESVVSTQYASDQSERRKKLKEIRQLARLQGLPPGFYRRPTPKEQKIIDDAVAERKKSNEQKILEHEQMILDMKKKSKIREDLKKTSFSDMMLIAQYLDSDHEEFMRNHKTSKRS